LLVGLPPRQSPGRFGDALLSYIPEMVQLTLQAGQFGQHPKGQPCAGRAGCSETAKERFRLRSEVLFADVSFVALHVIVWHHLDELQLAITEASVQEAEVK